MKNLKKLAVVSMAISTLTTASFAAESKKAETNTTTKAEILKPKPKMDKRKMRKPRNLFATINALDLSKEQKKKMDEFQTEHIAKLKAERRKKNRIASEIEIFSSALGKDGLNTDKALKGFTANYQENLGKYLDYAKKVIALLTPAQKDELKKKLQEMASPAPQEKAAKK